MAWNNDVLSERTGWLSLASLRGQSTDGFLPCTCLRISRRGHWSPYGAPKIPEHVRTRNHNPLGKRGETERIGNQNCFWGRATWKKTHTCHSWSVCRTPGTFLGSSWSWENGGTDSRIPPGPWGYVPCRWPRMLRRNLRSVVLKMFLLKLWDCRGVFSCMTHFLSNNTDLSLSVMQGWGEESMRKMAFD